MSILSLPRLLALMLLLVTLPAPAQGSDNPAGPSPALQYRSVFADYRSFSDQPVRKWTETNAVVAEIGGWRAYTREAAQPGSPAGAAAPARPDANTTGKTPADAPGPHAGHGAKP